MVAMLLPLCELNFCIPPLLQDQENWHLTFKVPDKHSLGHTVCEAIDTGKVSNGARRRITSLLKNLMLQYTLRPTPTQYTAVCNILVKKYPKLKDPIGANSIVC